MHVPKISIITPTFNRADYLEETILTVLNQNYPNLEYIIIDGGSTDRTLEIINKYKNSITYYVSEPDEGMYYAIQKGFEKSTGEIMTWLNSDDKYHQGALNIVGQIFSEIKETEWIIGTPSLFNKNGDCVKIFPNIRWSKSRFWVGDYKWIQQENVFWRRSLWQKAGNYIDTSFLYASDFELWNRFFQYSDLYSVQTSFAGFRLHGNQLSINFSMGYDNEVKKIIGLNKTKFRNKLILKLIWRSKNKLDCKKDFILRNLKVILWVFYNKLTKYPPVIHYDFDKNKWVI